MANNGLKWKKFDRDVSGSTEAKSHEGKQNRRHDAECQQLLLNKVYHNNTQPPDCQCAQPQKNQTPGILQFFSTDLKLVMDCSLLSPFLNTVLMVL